MNTPNGVTHSIPTELADIYLGLTRDQKSLLLYLESRATDHAGKLKSEQLNDADRANLDAWNKTGLVKSGRIAHKDLINDGCHLWAELSDNAWWLAHSLRRAKAKRLWDSRSWSTGKETSP